jgi:LPXTG-site transpeptidase (sortase) family protein
MSVVSMSGRAARRWLERALIGLGLACLVWAGIAFVQPFRYRARHPMTAEAPAAPGEAPARPPSAPALPAAPLAIGALVGRLEIPRIGLSELVAEGDDDGTLKAAIGHLPDTPLPWSNGNAALAGHRDAMFRPLEHIRQGDLLRIVTPTAVYNYRVRDTLIVKPEDVWVLHPTGSGRELTLITCYPFVYVGHAPNRFIVRADAVSEGDRGQPVEQMANRSS